MWEAVCIAIERQSSAFAGNRTILGGCVHLRHSYGVGLITVLLILAAALVGARLLSGAAGAPWQWSKPSEAASTLPEGAAMPEGSLTEVGANGEVGEAHETAGESVEENRDAAEMEHPDMAIEITDEHVADITNLANENEDGTPRKTRRRSASSA